jgi:hypothetical protein
MRTFWRLNLVSCGALFAGALCFGDTLTLKNGDVVDGTYLGGTPRILRMEVNGEVQTFDIGMVTSLKFSNPPVAGSAPPRSITPAPRSSDSSYPPPPTNYPSASSQPSYPSSYPSDRPVLRRAPNSDGDAVSSNSSSYPASAPSAPPVNNDPDRPILRRAPDSSSSSGNASSSSQPATVAQNSEAVYNNAPMPTPPPPPPQMELPAGTKLTVRMIDSVDSQVARVGDTFRASIDEPVSVNGQTVIPRGADVVAKLVEDDQSGKISGRTVMKLVLSTVRVNDKLVDITTSDVVKESSSRGARSAGVIGGGAVLGAIIGAAAGGGKGAAIGAGSGAAVGTGAEVISKGQRVKVPTETRLDFTLSYPVKI